MSGKTLVFGSKNSAVKTISDGQRKRPIPTAEELTHMSSKLCAPYEGDLPYLYISYCPEDMDIILPILRFLQDQQPILKLPRCALGAVNCRYRHNLKVRLRCQLDWLQESYCPYCAFCKMKGTESGMMTAGFPVPIIRSLFRQFKQAQNHLPRYLLFSNCGSIPTQYLLAWGRGCMFRRKGASS